MIQENENGEVEYICEFCHHGETKDLGGVYYRNYKPRKPKPKIAVHFTCTEKSDDIKNTAIGGKGEKLRKGHGYTIPGIRAYLDSIKDKVCIICDREYASIKCSYDGCNCMMHLPCARTLHSEQMVCSTQHAPQQSTNGLTNGDEEVEYYHQDSQSSLPDDLGIIPVPVKIKEEENNTHSQQDENDTDENSDDELAYDKNKPCVKEGRKIITTRPRVAHISMGFDFQKQVLLLFIITLREVKRHKGKEFTYSVGMEQKGKENCGDFDDIVVKYTLSNKEVYYYVQVKHSAAVKCQVIDKEVLFPDFQKRIDKEKLDLKEIDKENLDSKKSHPERKDNLYQRKYFESFKSHESLQHENNKIIFFINRPFQVDFKNKYLTSSQQLKSFGFYTLKFNKKAQKEFPKLLSEDPKQLESDYLKKVLFVVEYRICDDMVPYIRRLLRNEFRTGKYASQAYAELFTWASSWLNNPKGMKMEGVINRQFTRLLAICN